MRVPKVEMVSFNDMMELAGGSENVVVGIFLRIEGDAEGSMFFLSFLSNRLIALSDV